MEPRPPNDPGQQPRPGDRSGRQCQPRPTQLRFCHTPTPSFCALSNQLAIADAIEGLEKVKAKERQKAGGAKGGKVGGRGHGKADSSVESLHKANRTPRSEDCVAERVGTSAKTLTKARAVVRAAEDEPEKYQSVKDEMDRTGKVDAAHKKVLKGQGRKKDRLPQTFGKPNRGDRAANSILCNHTTPPTRRIVGAGGAAWRQATDAVSRQKTSSTMPAATAMTVNARPITKPGYTGSQFPSTSISCVR